MRVLSCRYDEVGLLFFYWLVSFRKPTQIRSHNTASFSLPVNDSCRKLFYVIFFNLSALVLLHMAVGAERSYVHFVRLGIRVRPMLIVAVVYWLIISSLN